MKIRGRKARTFCFRKTNFVQSRSGIYYALLLECFGLKFLPDVGHCVYWVLAEIWAPDSSHKISNKLFIDHSQGWKEGSVVCESVWFFSWVNTHLFDLKYVAFFKNFWKKVIWEKFSEIFAQTKAIQYRNWCSFPLLSAIFVLCQYCAEKINTSTFICCLHSGKDARP